MYLTKEPSFTDFDGF